MIGLVEWVKGKKIVSCPFGKKELEKFSVDITMDDICCFSKGKLNYLSSIPYHLQRS
jgi:hypothetical protein